MCARMYVPVFVMNTLTFISTCKLVINFVHHSMLHIHYANFIICVQCINVSLSPPPPHKVHSLSYVVCDIQLRALGSSYPELFKY